MGKKKVKIFVSHVNDYQKVTLAEENFNNQVDRISSPVAINQRVLPSHPCHWPRGSWTMWPRRKGCRLYRGSAIYTSTYQHQPGTSWCWMPNMPASESSTVPPIWHRSRGWAPGNLVDCTGLILSWKRQCFLLTGMDTYPEYEFAFPVHNASVKTTIRGCTECFTYSWGSTRLLVNGVRELQLTSPLVAGGGAEETHAPHYSKCILSSGPRRCTASSEVRGWKHQTCTENIQLQQKQRWSEVSLVFSRP